MNWSTCWRQVEGIDLAAGADVAFGAAVRGMSWMWRTLSAKTSGEPAGWATRIRAGVHKEF